MFNNLPKNWKSKKLEQLLTYFIGGDWGEGELISDEYVPVKIIKATDLTSWEADNGENAQIRYLKKSSIQKRELEDLDILLEISGGSTDQPVGRTVIIKKDQLDKNTYSCSNFFRLLRIDQNEINPEYLNYYFKFLYQTKIIEQYQSNSTNLRNLKFQQFINQQISYPSLKNEQKEIVDILDAMSNIIRLRKECIQHAQDLIPALFQEMFGNPIKNEKKYEIYAIKNLGKVTTGSTPSSLKENMYGGKIPFITPGDLETGKYKYNRYLTEKGSQNSRMVRAGSTMVCCIGATIGKVDKAVVDSCFNQQINAIEWNNEYINDVYALYLFRLLTPRIKEKASNTTLPILNKRNFENIFIPKPDIKLQKQFAQKAIEIENYIQEQQEELENAEQMFQSLLHHAFIGKLTKHKFGEING